MKENYVVMVKLGVGIMAIGLFANLFFGGGADKGVEIRSLVQDGALVVDVRTPGEFASGRIEGAINIPHDQVAGKIGKVVSDKNRAIIVYCQSGARSGAAKKSLDRTGYTQVVNGGSLSRMRKILAVK